MPAIILKGFFGSPLPDPKQGKLNWNPVNSPACTCARFVVVCVAKNRIIVNRKCWQCGWCCREKTSEMNILHEGCFLPYENRRSFPKWIFRDIARLKKFQFRLSKFPMDFNNRIYNNVASAHLSTFRMSSCFVQICSERGFCIIWLIIPDWEPTDISKFTLKVGNENNFVQTARFSTQYFQQNPAHTPFRWKMLSPFFGLLIISLFSPGTHNNVPVGPDSFITATLYIFRPNEFFCCV